MKPLPVDDRDLARQGALRDRRRRAVLVRVHGASICGTDLHINDWNEWAQGRITRLPMTFGHEVAGTVEAVGSEVHHVQPGTFVAAETHIACGVCSTCRSGRAHICRNLQILGVDTDGAFAEYVIVPAENAWIVGEGIHPDHASVMEPFGNAVHATFGTEGGEDLRRTGRRNRVRNDSGVSSGSLGLGAWKVIAIERTTSARARGEMGAALLVVRRLRIRSEAVLGGDRRSRGPRSALEGGNPSDARGRGCSPGGGCPCSAARRT